MARLPNIDGDYDEWGIILNQFLEVSHNGDGTLIGSAVSTAGAEMIANKGQAGGYAGLNGSGLLPVGILPTNIPISNLSTTGTASSSTFLRGDGTWDSLSGTYVPLAGGGVINMTGATAGLTFQYDETASGSAIIAFDHLGAPISALGNTGGWKTFGDRMEAGPGVFGPYIAIDGTTNPPSILFASPVYGTGGRLWAWPGTPEASWAVGATQVNDLWRDTSTGIDYVCTVAGALSTTVAVGSNGGNIANIATWANPSPGVLDVVSSTDFTGPGDVVALTTTAGTAYLTYTGIESGQLIGCALSSGSGTVSTGATVQSTAVGVSSGTWSTAVGVGALGVYNQVIANYTNTTATGGTMAAADTTSGTAPSITLPNNGRTYRVEFYASYCSSSTAAGAYWGMGTSSTNLIAGSIQTNMSNVGIPPPTLVAHNVSGTGQTIKVYNCSTVTGYTITTGAGGAGGLVGPSWLAATLEG